MQGPAQGIVLLQGREDAEGRACKIKYSKIWRHRIKAIIVGGIRGMDIFGRRYENPLTAEWEGILVKKERLNLQIAVCDDP